MTLWIMSWDDNGLEAVINLTTMQEKYVFDTLAQGNVPNPIPSIIDRLELRARYNQHRNYEIYTLKTEDDMDADRIRDYFDANPPAFKDLVRKSATRKIS